MRTLPVLLTLSDMFCIVKSYGKIKIIYWLTGFFVKQLQVFPTGYQTSYHAYDNIKKLLKIKLSIIDMILNCRTSSFICYRSVPLFNFLDITYNIWKLCLKGLLEFKIGKLSYNTIHSRQSYFLKSKWHDK